MNSKNLRTFSYPKFDLLLLDSMLGTSSRRQYKERKEVVKRNMNKAEWTRELDQVLMQSVIRNYFNFAAVAQELSHEARQ